MGGEYVHCPRGHALLLAGRKPMQQMQKRLCLLPCRILGVVATLFCVLPLTIVSASGAA
jgi:hypothetical protein